MREANEQSKKQQEDNHRIHPPLLLLSQELKIFSDDLQPLH